MCINCCDDGFYNGTGGIGIQYAASGFGMVPCFTLVR